jgi:hypothetical protein
MQADPEKQTSELTVEYEALLASSHVMESQHDRMIELSRRLKRGVWSARPATEVVAYQAARKRVTP